VLFDLSLLSLSQSYLYNKRRRKRKKEVDKIAFERDAKVTKESKEESKRDEDKINIDRKED